MNKLRFYIPILYSFFSGCPFSFFSQHIFSYFSSFLFCSPVLFHFLFYFSCFSLLCRSLVFISSTSLSPNTGLRLFSIVSPLNSIFFSLYFPFLPFFLSFSSSLFTPTHLFIYFIYLSFYVFWPCCLSKSTEKLSLLYLAFHSTPSSFFLFISSPFLPALSSSISPSLPFLFLGSSHFFFSVFRCIPLPPYPPNFPLSFISLSFLPISSPPLSSSLLLSPYLLFDPPSFFIISLSLSPLFSSTPFFLILSPFLLSLFPSLHPSHGLRRGVSSLPVPQKGFHSLLITYNDLSTLWSSCRYPPSPSTIPPSPACWRWRRLFFFFLTLLLYTKSSKLECSG